MGWPFGLVNIIISKILFALIGGTWLVETFDRNRGEGRYAFPYVPVIAAGAVANVFWNRSLTGGQIFIIDNAYDAPFISRKVFVYRAGVNGSQG